MKAKLLHTMILKNFQETSAEGDMSVGNAHLTTCTQTFITIYNH